MKSVLISIQPKWCELIASRKKTVEIRKTRPKIDTPFKCYIYCTKAKQHFTHGGIVETLDDLFRMPNGQIKFGYSGELMCCDEPYGKDNFLNGKVIGEFVCDSIMPYCRYEIVSGVSEAGFEELTRATQLSRKELYEYCGEKDIYCWHISDLVIYDEPKELSEFKTLCTKNIDCYLCNRYDHIRKNCNSTITRPPQSWCYVERKEDKGK